jgi:hypothetical protein
MNTTALPNVYLAFWNFDVKEPPPVDTVRSLLREQGLNPERAADVAASTALRRAADSLKTKTVETKCYTSKETQRTRAQVDEITEDNGRLRRSFVSQYELDEGGQPQHIAGNHLPDFVPAFDRARTHYTGADLSKVIQSVLSEDGLGAYSPRKNGGVYFVPVRPEAADLLTRIERFANAVSVRFLTYTVPDTAAQREEIADAIAQSYRDEINTHAEAIATYTHETRLGTISNRREAIQVTYEHMGRLRNLMNGRYESLRQQMADLINKLRNLATEIETCAEQAAHEQQQAGTRRIVTSGV